MAGGDREPDPKRVVADIENAAARLRATIAPQRSEDDPQEPEKPRRGLIARLLRRD